MLHQALLICGRLETSDLKTSLTAINLANQKADK